jgi:hypothetical protein
VDGRLTSADVEALHEWASQTEEGRFLWAVYWLWFGRSKSHQGKVDMSEGADSLNTEGAGLHAALWDAVREEAEHLDPRWRALADGTLAAVDVEALRVEASQTEDGRQLWELYRPFSYEERARIAEGVRVGLRARGRRV